MADEDIPSMYQNLAEDFYFYCSEISINEEYNSVCSTELNSNINMNSIFSFNNYISIKEMFFNCKLLSSLQDVLLFDTNNIIDISGLFYNCK